MLTNSAAAELGPMLSCGVVATFPCQHAAFLDVLQVLAAIQMFFNIGSHKTNAVWEQNTTTRDNSPLAKFGCNQLILLQSSLDVIPVL